MADNSPAEELRLFRQKLIAQRRAIVRNAINSSSAIAAYGKELSEVQQAIVALDEAVEDETRQVADSGLEGRD